MEVDLEHTRNQSPSTSSEQSASNATPEKTEDEQKRDQDSRYFPLDFMEFEILSRLSVESLLRCHCASRTLSSLIRSDSFVDSYLTRSSTRPSLLVTFLNSHNTERLIFSAPYLRGNPVSTATFHLAIPGDLRDHVSQSLSGLVCVDKMICNPNTRQFISLPRTSTRPPEMYHFVRNYLGYDPVNKEHKVLNVSVLLDPIYSSMMLNCVFSLKKSSWRRIEDEPLTHWPWTDGVCIDGILYYGAQVHAVLPVNQILVAFDLNLERFESFEFPEPVTFNSYNRLINWEGKPALLSFDELMASNQIDVLVLEDSSKEDWRPKRYCLPNCWRKLFGEADVFFVAGTVRTELIIASKHLRQPFYLFLYDPMTEIGRKIEIECLPCHLFQDAMQGNFTVSEHVDSITLLERFYF